MRRTSLSKSVACPTQHAKVLGVADHVKTWWPMATHAAARGGPRGLVRPTNGDEPKIDAGKGPPFGE